MLTPAAPALIRPGEAPQCFAMASTLVNAETQEHPVCSMTGEPLPRGSAIELGSFSRATIFDLFAGTWTPLIGLAAPKENRAVAPIFCGSHGEAPGLFSWCRAFFSGVDALPPSGRPLCLRIYDHPSTTDAAFYNTVSHPSWWFREPKAPGPAFVFMSLDEMRLSWESGADGAFRTVLPTGFRDGPGLRTWRRVFHSWRRRSAR